MTVSQPGSQAVRQSRQSGSQAGSQSVKQCGACMCFVFVCTLADKGQQTEFEILGGAHCFITLKAITPLGRLHVPSFQTDTAYVALASFLLFVLQLRWAADPHLK